MPSNFVFECHGALDVHALMYFYMTKGCLFFCFGHEIKRYFLFFTCDNCETNAVNSNTRAFFYSRKCIRHLHGKIFMIRKFFDTYYCTCTLNNAGEHIMIHYQKFLFLTKMLRTFMLFL